MAYKSQAILWARDAMRNSKPNNVEYIIYKYGTQNPEHRDDWLHMTLTHYESVKHLFPIMERVTEL